MDKLKMKLKQADWWEISYLIIYGAVFTFEFLNTTMFEVKWPPRFAYIFLASTALYVIAKFIWHNTYTKKEMIWAGIILFAFLMPALLTEYRFLWYTGFLIVGAKDIDFDKILKVYLTIGITIMLAAFVASQCGWIENLVYLVYRGEEVITRHSFGSVYPTDFAAHVFYIAIAGCCLSENKITVGKIVNLVVLALFVIDKCEARTSFICLLVMASFLIFVKAYKDKLKYRVPYYFINLSMVIMAGIYLLLTYLYDSTEEWISRINVLLSDRIAVSSKAVGIFEYRLFGQTIVETGFGRNTAFPEEYFFLDSSYIRVILLYGVVLFLIVMSMFWLSGLKAIRDNQMIVLFAIAAVGIHSFMEHHLIEIAYNPLLSYIFAGCLLKVKEDKQEVLNVS